MESVIYLVITFVGVMFLLLNLAIEYFAILILLIYVGAISILLLFVLIMVDLKELALQGESRKKKRLTRYIYFMFYCFIFFFLGFYFFYEYPILSMKVYTNQAGYQNFDILSRKLHLHSDLVSVGLTLYNDHFLAVILSSLILFITIVACIIIVTSYKKYSKHQEVAIQVMIESSLKLKKKEVGDKPANNNLKKEKV